MKNSIYKIAIPNIIITLLIIIFATLGNRLLYVIAFFTIFPVLYIVQGILNSDSLKNVIVSFLISSFILLVCNKYVYLHIPMYIILGLFAFYIDKLTNKLISLFIISITIIAIILNFDITTLEFSKATAYNFTITIIYFLLWLIISFYVGFKNNSIKYKTFLIIYWAIGTICLLLLVLNDKFSFMTDYIIIPGIWFLVPTYGIYYIFNQSNLFFIVILPILGFIISYIGYLIGKLFSKKTK